MAAVIAVVAVVAILVTAGPSRKPAAKPGGTPTAAVSPAGMDSILLGAAEVGTVLGDETWCPPRTATSCAPSRQRCRTRTAWPLFEPLQESVYRSYGPTAVRSETLHTPGDDAGHRVVEAAAFPSSGKARTFEASAEKWRAWPPSGTWATLPAPPRRSHKCAPWLTGAAGLPARAECGVRHGHRGPGVRTGHRRRGRPDRATDGQQGHRMTAASVPRLGPAMERPPSKRPVGQTGSSGAGWLRGVRQRA